VAYQIVCDVAACRAVIDRADYGQPTLSGRSETYCASCSAAIAVVDQEISVELNRRGFALAEELAALRRSKIAAAQAQQKGGTGLTPEWRIEVPS